MQVRVSVLDKIVAIAANILVTFAGASLALMMFIMAFDVIGRYFFNSPISGGLEMVEYFMAIIVPSSIAYCASRKSHVAVDLVVDHLPKPVKKILEIIVTCLSIIFVALISWQNFDYIFETYDSNLTSAVLKIPSYPFVASVCIGMAVFAFILFVHLFAGKTKEK